MTPLMIGGAPSSGTGPTGSNSTGLGQTTGTDGTDSFASVLAATDPASASAAVSVLVSGQGESAGGSAKSTPQHRPADPAGTASAAVLAADFAVAALAMPVPVPVPATPAAAAAWSGNQPAAGGLVAAAQPSAGLGQLAGTLAPVGSLPAGTLPSGAVPASAPTAATMQTSTPMATPTGSVPTPAATTPATAIATASTPATAIATASVSAPTMPATTIAPIATTPNGKAESAPVTAAVTAGSESTVQPTGSPTPGTTGQTSVTSTVPSGSPSVANPPGGPDIIPVVIANPPVELRQPAAPATKPTGTSPVVGHLPSSSPVLGSRPLPRPNTGSDTGSNDREHANTPLPSNVPVSGNGFSLADASAATPVPVGQPVPASPPISQPTSAPAAPAAPTADQPASQLPVSHQLSGPVLSLRTAGNGSHQLTIALHPAELGPVNLHVKILGDSMAIQLASTSEGAHDALRDALPQLRQELQAAGLPNVDLSLDLGGAPSGGHAQAGGHTQTSGEQHEAGHQAERPISSTPRRSTTTESGLDRWL